MRRFTNTFFFNPHNHKLKICLNYLWDNCNMYISISINCYSLENNHDNFWELLEGQQLFRLIIKQNAIDNVYFHCIYWVEAVRSAVD